MNTYKKLPWYRKTLLWLRYRPISMIVAVCEIIYLCFTYKEDVRVFPSGHKIITGFRKQVDTIWLQNHCMAAYDMGDCYSTEEVIEELKNRGNDGSVSR